MREPGGRDRGRGGLRGSWVETEKDRRGPGEGVRGDRRGPGELMGWIEGRGPRGAEGGTAGGGAGGSHGRGARPVRRGGLWPLIRGLGAPPWRPGV